MVNYNSRVILSANFQCSQLQRCTKGNFIGISTVKLYYQSLQRQSRNSRSQSVYNIGHTSTNSIVVLTIFEQVIDHVLLLKHSTHERVQIWVSKMQFFFGALKIGWTTKYLIFFGVPPQLSGFVCAFHSAAPGSSPKHVIYAFIIYSQICALFVM